MTPSNSSPDYAAIIGIDWADKKHDICLLAEGSTKVECSVIKHSTEALAEWIASLRQRFGGRKVAIALEQFKGALIHVLMEHDFIVLYPINPLAVSEFRKALATSGAKDDPVDAQLLMELVSKHPERFKPWKPDDVQTRHLARLVEARRKFVNLRTDLSNKLRSTLKGYFPQALELVGEDLFTLLACDFLAKWPALPELKKARAETIRKFYYGHQSRRGDVIASRLEFIEKATPLTTDAAIVESSVLIVQTLATQLRSLTLAVGKFDEKIAEVFAAHADAALFQSFPSSGKVFAPRLLAAFGADRQRYESATAMQQYSGIAPVTERSGKSCWIHWRYACPKFLRQSFHEYAKESIQQSLWAKAYYDQMIAKGSKHSAAVRALAFKWIRIMFRCWKDRVPYDEVRYLKALQKRGSPLLKLIAEPQPEPA